MTTRSAVRVAAWVTALGSVPPLVVALLFLAEDAGQSGEFLDGLGMVIGAVLVAIAAVPACVAWVALRPWRDKPRQGSWLLAVFGIVVALAGWAVTGALGIAIAATMVLGGLLVAAIAFLGLVVAPPARA